MRAVRYRLVGSATCRHFTVRSGGKPQPQTVRTKCGNFAAETEGLLGFKEC